MNSGKVTTDPEPGPSGGNDPLSSQTEERIEKYIEDILQKEISTALSEEKIGCIDYESGVNASKYKVCRLLKVRSVLDEYLGIKNCVAVNLSAHTGLIQSNVSTYLTDKSNIDKELDDSLNSIKDLKNKLKEVREAACKLEAARYDSCHSDQLKVIGKLPAGEDSESTGIDRFNEETTAIIEQTYELYEKSDDLFEKGVKVAGVLAFMNINSLEEMTNKLKTNANDLLENVASNMDDIQAKMDACQTAYEEGLDLVGAAHFNRNFTHITHLSLQQAEVKMSELAELDCSAEKNTYEDWKEDLETICDMIAGTFTDEINCKDNDGGTKFQKAE